jgi:hypothetical protein
VDWACFIEEIAGQYESAEKITLVMDNLNTHNPGSLYEMFPPDKAKALWDRFEFVYTPKHGSWLNMAEIELNVLTGQCLNRRIDDIEIVRKEVTAWQKFRNNKNAKVIYPKAIKVSDEEMAAINIQRDSFHKEWNYTISPKRNLQ